jgi:hypothetical protein
MSEVRLNLLGVISKRAILSSCLRGDKNTMLLMLTTFNVWTDKLVVEEDTKPSSMVQTARQGPTLIPCWKIDLDDSSWFEFICINTEYTRAIVGE